MSSSWDGSWKQPFWKAICQHVKGALDTPTPCLFMQKLKIWEG